MSNYCLYKTLMYVLKLFKIQAKSTVYSYVSQFAPSTGSSSCLRIPLELSNSFQNALQPGINRMYFFQWGFIATIPSQIKR